MEPQESLLKESPPAVIPSIGAGFNAIASRVYLIFLPLALDLFLWLGPRIRLKDLLLPKLNQAANDLASVASPEIGRNLTLAQEVFQQFLEQFNLLTLLRTFPIGVPSLNPGQGAQITPLGSPQIVEMTSSTGLLVLIGAILFFGLLLGGLYFTLVARSTAEETTPFNWHELYRQAQQVLMLFLICVIATLILGFPGLLLLSVFSAINPGLMQMMVFVMVMVMLWFLIPLLFSPHGIFANYQTALASMLTSVRMVRFYLPGTSMFLLVMMAISYGMNLLWRTAPGESWMALVGIFGHAFVSTGLLAASFTYYRGGLKWMNAQQKSFKPVKA